MNREKFIQSYKRTISNMDYNIIYPFTETELQPLYSKEWVDDFIKTSLYVNGHINSSVVRSMFVMDLFDLYYSNSEKEIINKMVNNYVQTLKTVYFNDDYFSFNGSNIPKTSRALNYDDYSYFLNNNKEIDLLLGVLFGYSYNKWGDIFADNSYETTGPHRIKYYKIINNTFYIGNDVYNILQYYNLSENIFIDLFGHSVANNCLGKVVLKNNHLLLDGEFSKEIDYINSLKNKKILRNEFENKKWLLESRLFRYKNIKNIDKNKYLLLLQNPLKERVCDKNKIIKILDDVLIKGGF